APLLWKGWGWVCRDDQGRRRPFRQRQIKPTRTISVSAGDLAATRLDGVRNIFAPFRFRTKFACVAEHVQLAVRSRCERKTRLIRQRYCVCAEIMFCCAVVFSFLVKFSVVDIT